MAGGAFVCLLFTLTHLVPLVICTCSTGWTAYNARCFFAGDNILDLPSAIDYCESRKSTLASVSSRRENNFLASQFKDRYWLGGRQISRGLSAFVWMDDTDFDYTNWQSYFKYEHTENSKCYGISVKNGNWLVLGCQSRLKPLCVQTKGPEKRVGGSWPYFTVHRLLVQTKEISEQLTAIERNLNQGSELRTKLKNLKNKQRELWGRIEDVNATYINTSMRLGQAQEARDALISNIVKLDQKVASFPSLESNFSEVEALTRSYQVQIRKLKSSADRINLEMENWANVYQNTTLTSNSKTKLKSTLHIGQYVVALIVAYAILLIVSGFTVAMWKRQSVLVKDLDFQKQMEVNINLSDELQT